MIFFNLIIDKKLTVNHITEEGIRKQRIYSVISRYIKTGKVEYSKNSGPQPSKLTKSNLNKIRTKYKRKPNISERSIAAQLNLSKGSVYRAKQSLNIKTKKKKIAPKYVKDQKERVVKNCKKMYQKNRSKFFIIDDESYVACTIMK